MNKQGYIKIIGALVNLLVVIMAEAGKVPLASAKQIGEAVMKAATGGGTEKK